MLLKLIDDLKRALDANCYFAALSVALVLPDICGKAEYPEMRTGQRYKKWFKEYIGEYEKVPCIDDSNLAMPYLSEEVVYSLRNSFLHQGTPNIDKDKISEEQNKIDRFELIIGNEECSDMISIENEITKIYRVSVRRLCLIIAWTAEGYYKENKEKFNFFNYTITNTIIER